LPDHLKTETYVAYDLEDTGGKVLLLRDLSFQSLPRRSASGIPTSFPTHLAAGELIDLAQVPASRRESLVEGLDYRSQWSNEEQAELQKAEAETYQQQPEQPEAEPAVSTGNRSRFYRSR
jgi:hypothetical protein